MLNSSSQQSIIIWLLSSIVQPGPNCGTVGLSRAVQPWTAPCQFTDVPDINKPVLTMDRLISLYEDLVDQSRVTDQPVLPRPYQGLPIGDVTKRGGVG